MTFDSIKADRDGGLMWLTLDRPNEANALNIPVAGELGAAFALAESDPDCHVLILQGSGRYFCAGGDVAGMADSEDKSGYLLDLAGAMHEVILAMARSRLVTIAAVHGPAAGAGLGLVLNSDFVLASPEATFLSAYAGVGLTPDCGVSYLLPHVVGPRRAAQMCLAGRVATAREGIEWGLASELVELSELRERTRELGESLAGGATQTLGPTRRLLTSVRLSGYAEHLKEELSTISRLGSEPDTMRRIAAFGERARAKVRP
ncbi:enoyl-CoA hydratase/isomerase family protein [Arthrobacter bambusae]|uniref:enoyl-CoA hydratase/isomerase family protein n=1 Tax=Arthrobacter bambusae TaxID=1338426 RepID=UPI00278150C8|nr:enoyl-CoA hydratase/isomerase family protein [Arthrobacter bambusae]MDQ0242406.1 2-(1,2-epoxy-1,2-dihydrophenyl)acetyl-CoA isomerase [Arthrobacter bambusae]